MMQRQGRARRTVVVGAGPTGLAVIEGFRRRMAERIGELPTVACLAVIGEGDRPAASEPPPALSMPAAVVLPLDSAGATRGQVRQRLADASPVLVAVLTEALVQVSRISTQMPGLQSWLKPASPPFAAGRGEVACYVVAALDEVLGSALFVDLAFLIRTLVDRRLNAIPSVSGLLFLPDLLLPAGDSPALAQTYAALRELDAAMRPGDGYWSLPGDDLRAEVGQVAFDQGCYLIGAINAEGLGLENPGERVELAAEALFDLAFTPLGADRESPALPLPAGGARPQGYGALGLAAMVYPRHALAEALACRLARQAVAGWFQPNTRAGAEPPLLPGLTDEAEAILAAEVPDEARIWRPLVCHSSPRRVCYLRQDLEDEMAARLEPLAARRPELDRRAAGLGSRVAESAAQAAALRLDRLEPGRLAATIEFLDAIEAHLARLRAETEQAADGHWQVLEALDCQLQRLAGEMDALAARLAPLGQPGLRAVVSLLGSPRRVLDLARAYRDLLRAGAAYGAIVTRQMATTMEVLRRDLLVEVCEQAEQDLRPVKARLAGLGEAARSAQEELAGGQAGVQRLYGSLGSSLEQSVLTPEGVERLYELVQDHDQWAADVPLSGWLAAADGRALAAACLEQARRCCRVLEGITADELVAESLAAGGDAARMDALRGLIDLASPFLGWDETRLQGTERQYLRRYTLLGLSDGRASPLLEGADDLPARVVATRDGQRITALATVWGLPLAAVSGLDEYAAAYRAANPADLHGEPGCGDLPDPALDMCQAEVDDERGV